MNLDWRETYTASGNYVLNQATVFGGVGSLSQPVSQSSFNQSFNSSGGFVYDSSLARFDSNGVLRQIDQRPANASFFAGYSTSGNFNANWANGNLAPLAIVGDVSVSGGALNLTGGVANKYVDYAASGGNADSTQTGCVRMKITPNYSGSPGTGQNFFRISQADGSQNNIVGVFHAVGGLLNLRVFSNTGASIITVTNLATFSPTAGQTYEIEFNWDLTAGASRLFIDGVQQGATQTQTGTRSGQIALFRIGESQTPAGNFANFSVQSCLVFSTVQHTANYSAPSPEPADFIYLQSSAILPTFNYPGPTSIRSLNSFTSTTSGSPRYIIGGRYFTTGSGWTTSSGGFGNSNSLSGANNNLATYPLTDPQTSLGFTVAFGNTNTRMAIDDLTFLYSGNFYTPSGSIQPITTVQTDRVNSLAVTGNGAQSVSGNYIKYGMMVNGTLKYFNGVTWVNSDGSVPQLNTYGELTATSGVLATLVDQASNVGMALFLIGASPSGYTTPTIDETLVNYSFRGVPPVPPVLTPVYFYLKDVQGNPVRGATVLFEPKIYASQYLGVQNPSVCSAEKVRVVTDASGYGETNLIVSNQFQGGSLRYQVSMIMPDGNIRMYQDFYNNIPLVITVPSGGTPTDITTLISGIV